MFATPPRILLINPNSTASMTATMAEVAKAALAPGSTLISETAEYGPASIEGYYDEVFSIHRCSI